MRQNKLLLVIGGILLSLPGFAAGPCKVVYSCGSGANGPAPESHTANADTGSFVVAENTCSKSDYSFEGWLITSSSASYAASGDIMQPGDTYTNTNCKTRDTLVLTLTAQWAALGDRKIPTSKKYVDDGINSKLDKITVATNSAITFPTTGTDEQLGAPRGIVATLGTPNATSGDYSDTTSTTIPTTGAVLTGVNRKQYISNGSANYVMTQAAEGGEGGMLGAAPIYTTTNKTDQGFIDAVTLNNAIIDAVNHEFTQVDENGIPDSNGSLWRLENTVRLVTTTPSYLDIVDNAGQYATATGYCGQNFGTPSTNTQVCNTGILDSLSKGTWRLDFINSSDSTKTFTINGSAICSSVVPTSAVIGNISADSKQLEIQQTYSTSFVSGGNGKYCYCKMTDPAISKWVYSAYTASLATCIKNCATKCAIAGGANESQTSFRNPMLQSAI